MPAKFHSYRLAKIDHVEGGGKPSSRKIKKGAKNDSIVLHHFIFDFH